MCIDLKHVICAFETAIRRLCDLMHALRKLPPELARHCNKHTHGPLDPCCCAADTGNAKPHKLPMLVMNGRRKRARLRKARTELARLRDTF